MANDVFSRSDTRALCQERMSKRMISLLFKKMTIAYFIFAKMGDKTALENIGVQSVASLISGVPSALARQDDLFVGESYMPLIDAIAPNNNDTKRMNQRDRNAGVGDGGGTGAAATAALSGSGVSTVAVVAGGYGYQGTMTPVFTGGGGSGASLHDLGD